MEETKLEEKIGEDGFGDVISQPRPTNKSEANKVSKVWHLYNIGLGYGLLLLAFNTSFANDVGQVRK